MWLTEIRVIAIRPSRMKNAVFIHLHSCYKITRKEKLEDKQSFTQKLSSQRKTIYVVLLIFRSLINNLEYYQ